MSSSIACPCGSHHALAACCGRYHEGLAAPSAEQLMRSRYSAYVLAKIDYLQRTTLPAQQALLDLEAIRQWSLSSQWLGLEVEQVSEAAERASVRFNVHWQDPNGTEHQHQECSAFVRLDGRWYFIDPTVKLDLGRNDPCPCGSGRKYKKCCMGKSTPIS